jgi:hypothetical protein
MYKLYVFVQKPFFSNSKITEILLKVLLNTINQTNSKTWLYWMTLYFLSIKFKGQPLTKQMNLINQFNPATSLCLSQPRTWISNVIRHMLLIVRNSPIPKATFFTYWYKNVHDLLFACFSFSSKLHAQL